MTMTEDLPTVAELRASEKRLIGDYLELDGEQLRCAKCRCDFGPADGNYKERLALRERDIEDLGRLWIPTSTLVDDEMTFREFYCPGCATRITTEVVAEGEAIVEDMSIDVE